MQRVHFEDSDQESPASGRSASPKSRNLFMMYGEMLNEDDLATRSGHGHDTSPGSGSSNVYQPGTHIAPISSLYDKAEDLPGTMLYAGKGGAGTQLKTAFPRVPPSTSPLPPTSSTRLDSSMHTPHVDYASMLASRVSPTPPDTPPLAVSTPSLLGERPYRDVHHLASRPGTVVRPSKADGSVSLAARTNLSALFDSSTIKPVPFTPSRSGHARPNGQGVQSAEELLHEALSFASHGGGDTGGDSEPETRLRSKLMRLATENSALQRKAQTLDSSKVELSHRYDAANEIIKKNWDVIGEKCVEVDDLRRKYKDTQVHVEAANEVIANNLKALGEKQVQNDKLLAEKLALETELANTQAHLLRTEKTVETLSMDLKNLSAESQGKEDAMNALLQGEREAHGALRSIHEKCPVTLRELREQEAHRQAELISTMELMKQENEAELARLRADNTQALSDAANAHELAMTTLQSQHEEAISALQSQHHEILSTQQAQHEHSISSMRQRYEEQLSSSNDRHDEDIRILRDEHTQFISELRDEHNRVLESVRSAAADREMRMRSSATQSEREALETANMALEELHSIKRTGWDLREHLKREDQRRERQMEIAQGEMAKLNETIVQLQEQLDDAKENNKDLTLRISTVREEIEMEAKLASQRGGSARPAPTGENVTLVAVDLPASVLLWDYAADEMKEASTMYIEFVREKIKRFKGYEIKIQGESFLVAFTNILPACLFVTAMQEGLLSLEWPAKILGHKECAEVKDSNDNLIFRGFRCVVGMATGQVFSEADPLTGRVRYQGPLVTLAEKICDSAHGGQTLIDGDRTYPALQAIIARLPGATCEDMGTLKIYGLDRTVGIWDLRTKGVIGREFPPPVASQAGVAPEGTVSLAMCDVAAPTNLWSEKKDTMWTGLVVYSNILRQLARKYRGYEVNNIGAGFTFAFHEPEDASQWAIALQLKLMDAPWSDDILEIPACAVVEHTGSAQVQLSGPLFRGFRVRIGIHTAQANTELDAFAEKVTYRGEIISVATDLMEAAHAGQTVVSKAVADAIKGKIEDTDLIELGSFPLKTTGDAYDIVQVSPVRLAGREFGPPITTSKLQGKFEEMAQENAQLVGKLADMEKEAAQANAQVKELEDRLARMKENIGKDSDEVVQERIRELVSELTSLRESAQVTDAALTEAREIHKTLLAELAAMQATLEETETKLIEELHKARTAGTKQINELSRTAEEMAASKKELVGNLTVTRKERAALAEKKKKLEAQLAESAKALRMSKQSGLSSQKALNSEVEKARETLAQKAAEIEQLTKDKSDLTDQLKRRTESLRNFNGKIRDLNDRETQVEKDTKESISIIDQCLSQLRSFQEESESKITSLEEEQSELRDLVETLKSQIDGERNEYISQKQVFTETEELLNLEIESLSTNLDACVEALDEIQREFADSFGDEPSVVASSHSSARGASGSGGSRGGSGGGSRGGSSSRRKHGIHATRHTPLGRHSAPRISQVPHVGPMALHGDATDNDSKLRASASTSVLADLQQADKSPPIPREGGVIPPRPTTSPGSSVLSGKASRSRAFTIETLQENKRRVLTQRQQFEEQLRSVATAKQVLIETKHILEQDKVDLTSRVEELEGELSKTSDENAVLKAALEKQQAAMNALTSEYSSTLAEFTADVDNAASDLGLSPEVEQQMLEANTNPDGGPAPPILKGGDKTVHLRQVLSFFEKEKKRLEKEIHRLTAVVNGKDEDIRKQLVAQENLKMSLETARVTADEFRATAERGQKFLEQTCEMKDETMRRSQDSWSQQLHQLEDEIARLRQQVLQTNEENTRCGNENRTLKREVDALRFQVEEGKEIEARLRKREAELTEIGTRLRLADEDLVRKNRSIADLTSDLDRETKSLQENRELLAQARKDGSELRERLAASTAANVELQDEVNAAQKLQTETSHRLSTKEAQLLAMTQAHDALETELNTAKLEHAQVMRDLSRVRDDLQENKRELSDLHTDHTSLKTEHNQVRSNLAETTRQRDAVQRSLDEAAEKYSKLKASFEKSVRDNKARFDEAHLKWDAERGNLQGTVSTLKNNLSEVSSLLSQSRREVARVKAHNGSLKEQLEQVEVTTQQLREQVAQLQATVSERDESLASCREDCQQLRQQIRELLAEIEDLRRQLAEKPKEVVKTVQVQSAPRPYPYYW